MGELKLEWSEQRRGWGLCLDRLGSNMARRGSYVRELLKVIPRVPQNSQRSDIFGYYPGYRVLHLEQDSSISGT